MKSAPSWLLFNLDPPPLAPSIRWSLANWKYVTLPTDEFWAQVHSNLGVIYSERKDYVRAALQYERALDLDAHFPAALYNYGNDLLKTGSYRRAVRLFSKSLRLYPTDVWALNNRGLAFLKLGKRDKARL